MRTKFVCTLASGVWTYTKDGGAVVTPGTSDMDLPMQYMNDSKQELFLATVTIQVSGLAGTGGTFKIKQNITEGASDKYAMTLAVAIADNESDIDMDSFVNRLLTGIGVVIYKGSMTDVVMTINILINEIVNK